MEKLKYTGCAIGILLSTLALQIVASIFLVIYSRVLYALSLTDIPNSTTLSTGIMLVYSVVIITIFSLLFYKCFNGEFNLSHIKGGFSFSLPISLAFIVPLAQLIVAFFMGFCMAIMPSQAKMYSDLMESSGIGNSANVLMQLYVVFLGPIAEELIFRGVTLGFLKRGFSFWPANIIQAILFGVYHMNVIQGLYAFLLGVFLGFIFEYTGSIYYSTLFHMCFNSWSLVLDGVQKLGFSQTAAVGFEVILAVSLSLYGIFLFKKGLIKRRYYLKTHGYIPF